MSGPEYPGQGNSQNYGGQWGGQPSGGFPPAQSQNPAQWQGNQQGSVPGWNGGAGAPQNWGGGPGGVPPYGQQPGGGRKGPGVGIIVAIVLLVVALIAVLVGVLVLRSNNHRAEDPAAGESSSITDTPSEPTEPEDPQETPGEPAGEPSASETGGSAEFSTADLPAQIGEWKLSEYGFLIYERGAGGAVEDLIGVSSLGSSISEYADAARQSLHEVEDIDGGFCGLLDGGSGMAPICYISPGKKPDNIVSVSGTEVEKAEVIKVAKAIVAYK